MSGSTGWVSGLVGTVAPDGKGKSWQYGYFETRMKLPPGLGLWPSFWMLSQPGHALHGNTGEIDVFEAYGVSDAGPTGNYIITLHDWTPGATLPFQQSITTGDLTTDFHVWGMLWTATQMVFYFDGNQVAQVPTPDVMHQPYFPMFVLGLGGGWPTNQTPNPSNLQIDYLRIYQTIPSDPSLSTVHIAILPKLVPAGATQFLAYVNFDFMPTIGPQQWALRLLDCNNVVVGNTPWTNTFWSPISTTAGARGQITAPEMLTFPVSLAAGTYTLTLGFTASNVATQLNQGLGVMPSPESGRQNEYVIGTVKVG
jgi:hypothetical protein